MQLSAQDLLRLFICPGEDWPIKAISLALENKGVDLAEMAQVRNITTGTIRNAFYRDCPAYEEEIAMAIGVEPAVIWPRRYQRRNKKKNPQRAVA
ncbi:helix-turn-helix domain-containing protein [Salmonella enterica]|uniref:Transcriptional regulator n=2 Tax=Salmonella enterica TaxID=28901 RepID=A0A748AJX1_SALER|nr:helix-turn-helix domain-containing protein [Salmonella bongori]EAA4373488.1 transcriptional regulator [Salmonella enterica subsp. enterica serovar Abony]EAA5550121.1 transcriptional regulator [Salmonella enterica subsp. enterica serovar Newport]EAC0555117.1 transcriptional regulator [Salmonella enterica subsp. enterica serovar Richmond]EAZ0194338.1 transcriptional regulator [Salmonella enterica]EBU7430748.1 transcriptional regulator [Salmonella enterica subsp. enterica serovar Kottbus]EBY1